jgi:hypothetical protein
MRMHALFRIESQSFLAAVSDAFESDRTAAVKLSSRRRVFHTTARGDVPDANAPPHPLFATAQVGTEETQSGVFLGI